MDSLDITRNPLYIKQLIRVIESHSDHSARDLYVNDRHSDAFVYIVSGSCTYETENLAVSVKQGDVLYLPFHAVYTMHIHSELYQFIFCDFIFNCPTQRKICSLTPRTSVEPLFRKILTYYRRPSMVNFSKCLSLLYQIYEMFFAAAEVNYTTCSAREKMEKARAYIHSRFSDSQLSIAAIAEKFGISEVYFRKLFKAHYGLSPSEYIGTVRIENAKAMLQYPFLSLEDCAAQSGFSSLQYFCRAFKKATGVSPGTYKKEYAASDR